MSPRPQGDFSARVYRVLAGGGRWTAAELTAQVYASAERVRKALHRLEAQGLAVRYLATGTNAHFWVAVDPRGCQIKDVENITGEEAAA